MSDAQAWRRRAECAEDAIRSVRELVQAWEVSDEQLANVWVSEEPQKAATMVLMSKASNRFGEQILEALDGVAPLGNSVRVTND